VTLPIADGSSKSNGCLIRKVFLTSRSRSRSLCAGLNTEQGNNELELLHEADENMQSCRCLLPCANTSHMSRATLRRGASSRPEQTWTASMMAQEPEEGCVTTMEAVSCALGVLEGQGVTDALMAPLRLMTRLQVSLRRWHASHCIAYIRPFPSSVGCRTAATDDCKSRKQGASELGEQGQCLMLACAEIAIVRRRNGIQLCGQGTIWTMRRLYRRLERVR